MQPQGVNAADIGIAKERELKLQYDVLNSKFIPSMKEQYSEKEKNFLLHHIDMFCGTAIYTDGKVFKRYNSE